MRLFLLPVSTRRSLIYCERVAKNPNVQPGYLDRITHKASTTWADWEKAESGWKKQLTTYGNQVLNRIPYQEWGLKSIPPISEARKKRLLEDNKSAEVVFPAMFLKEDKVTGILEQLATERQGLHRKRLIWSVIGMPISAPFALVPVVPNIPFFYLAFRAYSHWKALSGARHLSFLVSNNLIKPTPSHSLDALYAAGVIHPTRQQARDAPMPNETEIQKVSETVEQQSSSGKDDVLILHRWNGKLLAESVELPEMEVEIERAVEQVQTEIQAKVELDEEKKHLEEAKKKDEAMKTDEVVKKP